MQRTSPGSKNAERFLKAAIVSSQPSEIQLIPVILNMCALARDKNIACNNFKAPRYGIECEDLASYAEDAKSWANRNKQL